MAEAILFDIATGILTKLGSRAVQEIGLWWGVKDEMERLERTVSTIRAVLLDAEEQFYSEKTSTHQVKHWLGKLKEAVYDADDLLDDFSTEALRRNAMSGCRFSMEVRLFFSSSNQFAYGLKMGRKIKDVRDRLDEIASDRNFHLMERSAETSSAMVNERMQTHSSLPEIVVGRENDRKEIIQLVMSADYDDNVVVIPVVGIGGLGKTTLAQLVFNDQEVCNHFEQRLWVCVSENFDVKLIIEKIIESASGGKPKNLEMNTVKDLLHEKISGKKYLLILDDVWNENAEKWCRLKDMLICGERGSKIIITTRLKRVAEITSSIPPYQLQGLFETESWTLFRQMAFKRGQGRRTPGHETIGKEIVAKCKGVPLAIKTIGRLLYFKDTESEWLSFKNEEFSKLKQNEDDILPTLKLSYNHLPSHLKQCFAYCRLIPKDHDVRVTTLIRLWIAQGYIVTPSNSNQCLEDAGLEYWKDLLWRSFLEVCGKDELGNIISCKMHDLMHDLAALVAGRESTCISCSNVGDFDGKTRHVSIYFDKDTQSKWHVPTSLYAATKLRSILFPTEDWRQEIEEEQCLVIFSKFRCLRVLDLHDMGIKTVPQSVHKLRHLRYLDLSHNEDIELLPESITMLLNLQVLKLDWCNRLQALPKGIKNLVNLTVLGILGCYDLTHMPCGIGKLTSLLVLSQFVVGEDKSGAGLGELHALNYLRGRLHIKNLQCASQSKAANLKEKHNLEKLTLEWAEDNDSDDSKSNVSDEMALEELQPHSNLRKFCVEGFGGLKFPSWLSSLTNLKELRVAKCKRFQHFPPLHYLPSLDRLFIEELIELEYIQINGVNNQNNNKRRSELFLPSLKLLSLRNCPNLKAWWPTSSTTVETEEHKLAQFHHLSDLNIEFCPNLTSIPRFPPLESLCLRDANVQLWRQTFRLLQAGSFSPSSLSCPSSQVKLENSESLQEESLPYLTSLKFLSIYGGPGISIFSRAMQYLSSLVYLCIGDCEELDDDMQWQSFCCLGFLSFENISRLASLPKGIQLATTLNILDISNCPNLTSLPEWMTKLTSLQDLTVEQCPHLSERCGNNMAENWPLIAHIPNICVDGTEIQKYGRYKL